MNFTIGSYLWGQTGPFPEVRGSLVGSAWGLELWFNVRETELRAMHANHNEMVCEDSCVEFFCTPYLDDPRYLNIEINPLGTVLMGIGIGRRPNRERATAEQIAAMEVRTAIERDEVAHWTVNYSLPYGLIAELYGREPMGRRLRCNFYKCGDLHQKPHWGSWMPVETEKPDFHRPEFFGEVLL